MKSNIELTQEVAECVGLWLAEGDTKTTREITFTDNCPTLIEFFAKTIQQIFKEDAIKSRVYVYSAKKENRKKSSELANEMGICWKSAYHRLLELQKLNLVDKDMEGNWKLLQPKKEVIVL